MRLPYYLVQLKADLSIDDCVDFLNSVTNNGNHSFKNIYVALPFSRLNEMTSTFKESGITFGSSEMNLADPGSFTAPIAAKMVKDASGTFTLIGTEEERKVHLIKNSQLKNKCILAHESGLKVIFCVVNENIQEDLEILKISKALESDKHPLIVYQPSFTLFKDYHPNLEELNQLYGNIKQKVDQIFGLENEISILIHLPADLVGFSETLSQSPFQGAFFIKSGVYPHAVHQEAIQLFHVHAEEKD